MHIWSIGNPHSIKAAILIQRWYRRYVARLEMRRRYTWNIFQSIEYAGEQDHCMSQFFSMILLLLLPHSHDSSHVLFPPDLISHLLDSVVDPLTEEARQLKYEQIVVPESYSGPRLSFPLSVTDTNALLCAFKEEQVQHYKTFTNSLNKFWQKLNSSCTLFIYDKQTLIAFQIVLH
uniref:Uncharacterized protein n=1 Tax=Sinocyclocheilus grahami TaxID=75366 RepID=A0A672MDM1_SINGR